MDFCAQCKWRLIHSKRFIVIAVGALRVTTEYDNKLYLDDFSYLRSYNLFEIGCHGCGLLCVVTVVARLLLRVVTVVARLLLRVVTVVARLLLCVVTLVARLLLRVVVMVTLSGCCGGDVSRLYSSRVILVGSCAILVLLDGCTSGKENEEMRHKNSDSLSETESDKKWP